MLAEVKPLVRRVDDHGVRRQARVVENVEQFAHRAIDAPRSAQVGLDVVLVAAGVPILNAQAPLARVRHPVAPGELPPVRVEPGMKQPNVRHLVPGRRDCRPPLPVVAQAGRLGHGLPRQPSPIPGIAEERDVRRLVMDEERDRLAGRPLPQRLLGHARDDLADIPRHLQRIDQAMPPPPHPQQPAPSLGHRRAAKARRCPLHLRPPSPPIEPTPRRSRVTTELP